MTTIGLALRARTFRSLRRHRNYRIFFTGQLVSLAGTWMQNVALAWLVIERARARGRWSAARRAPAWGCAACRTSPVCRTR